MSVPIGRYLRDARRRRGLSQASLAGRVGIPQSHIAKIEGGADPRYSTVSRIFAALGLELVPHRSTEELAAHPPRGSKLEAALAFGVDLGRLYARQRRSPADRLEAAVAEARGLAELLR